MAYAAAAVLAIAVRMFVAKCSYCSQTKTAPAPAAVQNAATPPNPAGTNVTTTPEADKNAATATTAATTQSTDKRADAEASTPSTSVPVSVDDKQNDKSEPKDGNSVSTTPSDKADGNATPAPTPLPAPASTTGAAAITPTSVPSAAPSATAAPADGSVTIPTGTPPVDSNPVPAQNDTMSLADARKKADELVQDFEFTADELIILKTYEDDSLLPLDASRRGAKLIEADTYSAKREAAAKAQAAFDEAFKSGADVKTDVAEALIQDVLTTTRAAHEAAKNLVAVHHASASKSTDLSATTEADGAPAPTDAPAESEATDTTPKQEESDLS